MEYRVEKIAIYRFFNVCRHDKEDIEEVVKAVEGDEPDIVVTEDIILATVVTADEGRVEDYNDILTGRITTLQDALNQLNDDKACNVELAYADPGTEVYVCWNHRKIWEIDVSEIGAQLDNLPKNCNACKSLIKEVEKL